MMEFLKTLLIAFIPAVITGLVSYLVAKTQAKTTIDQLRVSNEHEINRLMEQHKIDIDSLKEKQRLELELKEKDHQHVLEILQKEHENEIIRKEKELENETKYSALGNIFNGLLGGTINTALNTPEVQKEISEKLIAAMKK